jgi:hypothetical protein
MANKKIEYSQNRRHEFGNALFLILIAVTLFAALSYAVTRSNRGGGSVSEEANLIASSQITQYPAGVRTGITRMLIRGSSVSGIQFDIPGESGYTSNVEDQVFHPEGGGVVNQSPDAEALTTSSGSWEFNTDFTVSNIGTSDPEMVAVLGNIKDGICENINQQLTGDDTIPSVTDAISDLESGTVSLSGAGIDGQPFLCVEASDGNAYYHVLLEQ